jgi:transcription antitermination factor NusG
MENLFIINKNGEDGQHSSCWYALRVEPNHEKVAGEALKCRGYEIYVPVYRSRRRWSDRIKEIDKPLFPGYIFCRFARLHRAPVLATPGVRGVISFNGRPEPVSESEIATIQRVVRSGLNLEPWPYLNIGDRVRLTDGPLAGIEGILLKIREDQRLIISATLLQRSLAVEIDGRWVRPRALHAATRSMLSVESA